MNDLAPIFLADPPVRDGEPEDTTRLRIECDDAGHLTQVLKKAVAAGRTFVSTDIPLEDEQGVVLTFSFPGLLRSLCLTGIITGTIDTPAGEAASGPGHHVALVGLDSDSEKRLNEVLEKIENRDSELVARAIRVLVVEDNPHCAKLIQEGLHLAGKRAFGNRVVFDVPMASNAADAFTFLHSRPIDVLITDIYLGGVSGTTVIEHVRRDSGLRTIPVIAISAGDDATRQVAMEAGADVFLPKPVRLRQIVGTVGKVLKLEQVAWR